MRNVALLFILLTLPSDSTLFLDLTKKVNELKLKSQKRIHYKWVLKMLLNLQATLNNTTNNINRIIVIIIIRINRMHFNFIIVLTQILINLTLFLMAYLVCTSQISWCDEVFAGTRVHRPRGSSEPCLTSALLLHSTRPWSSPLLRPRYFFFSVVTDSAIVLFVIQWTLLYVPVFVQV